MTTAPIPKEDRPAVRVCAALVLALLLTLAGCGRQPVPEVPSEAPLPSQSTAPGEPEAKSRGTISNPDFDERVTPEMQEQVLLFMDTYFAATADLNERDLSDFFDKESFQGREALALNRMTLDYLLKVRGARAQDLTLDDYEYEITFWGIRESDEIEGAIRFSFIEASRVNFAFLSGVDSTHVGFHTVELVQREDGCYFTYHLDRQDVPLAISKEYGIRSEEVDDLTEDAMEEIVAGLGEELERELGEGLSELEDQKWAGEDMDSSTQSDHPYDRTTAAQYAWNWVSAIDILRNNEWQDYEMLGGDCTNFTSQSLFAGGIPMDIKGDALWKWYGDTPSTRQTAAGRSPSWSGVKEFYEYSAANTGFGLVAQADANYYTAQEGDILQFWALGSWRHALVITEVIVDEKGVPVDYLVASHSADRKDYPASAYLFPKTRLIRILGWND